MAILFLLVLAFLSRAVANHVGRHWSESKEVGGSFRVYIIAVYILAIVGFTIVYDYILLLTSMSFFMIRNVNQEILLMFEQFSTDLIYLFFLVTLVPDFFYIWIRSLKYFWKKKTLDDGLIAVLYSCIQIFYIIFVIQKIPSAISRTAEILFLGGNSKKIVLLAIFLLIFAVFGGYFKASKIMKKTDREYNIFARNQEKRN